MLVKTEKNHHAVRIGDGDCIVAGFHSEGAAAQIVRGTGEIGNSEYDEGIRCRSRGFEFYFVAGVSRKPHADRLAGGYVLETQLGRVEDVLRDHVLHWNDSAQQMLRNATVTQMFATIFKMK